MNPRESWEKILRVWDYLWATYHQNGWVPRHVSDALDILREQMILEGL
jgi:hypothetical protein